MDHKKSLTELEARLRKSLLNPEEVICTRTKILVKTKKSPRREIILVYFTLEC